MIRQGDIRWADLPTPRGSEPGYRRPVIVVQGDGFNQSRLRTVVCVAVTSNVALAEAPGNVLLDPMETGLSRPSVANVSQLVTMDKERLEDRIGHLSGTLLDHVLLGIDVVLDRLRP